MKVCTMRKKSMKCFKFSICFNIIIIIIIIIMMMMMMVMIMMTMMMIMNVI